jgi:hypothetical protein
VAQDISETAIITPSGFFNFLFLPLKLKNAAQTFHRIASHQHYIFRQAVSFYLP